ncbi:iron ABC transporter permease [Romboutsia weinsteinii]|uniref:Iron ABC transporter permease n=2 Tax=Romboutsia weinsteinii TaxID=2020949 RepID=A0A371J4E2_9FIRM|nr:iron ABC transporter permease [Romboutsia weinsteinii]
MSPLKKRKVTKSFGFENILKYLMYAMLAWFIVSFLVIPNINTLYTTFFIDGSFSLEAVQKLLSSERAMSSLKNSFILAVSLSVTVNIIGISLVLLTDYFDIKGSKILRLGYMTTLIYGGLILVSGYKFIYGGNGFITNFLVDIFPNMNQDWFVGYWAVLFVMTFACTSNHLIFLSNAIKKLDFQTIEAAKNMGASTFLILRRVVLPTLLPSIFAVTILIFITGLGATSAPLIVGGESFQTITPMILTFSKSIGSRDLAAMLSIFLGMATVILLVCMNHFEKKGNYMSVSKVKTTIVKQKINNKFVNVLAHIYAYALFLIYVVPVVLIILFSFTDAKSIATGTLSFSSFTLNNYISLITNESAYKPFIVSILYSLLASIGVIIITVSACRIIHKVKNKWSDILEYSLLLPWLLPSTLIAIGLITTFDKPQWFIGGNILVGTLVVLLLAYIIVKIPYTLRMIKAAFFSIDDTLEDASKNLGASSLYTFFRILLPIILPSVLSVFALNFNSLLTDYDLSVFLYHPLYQPLGVFIKNLTDANTVADNTTMTFVYAVIVMIISSITLYLVYGRDVKKTKKG